MCGKSDLVHNFSGVGSTVRVFQVFFQGQRKSKIFQGFLGFVGHPDSPKIHFCKLPPPLNKPHGTLFEESTHVEQYLIPKPCVHYKRSYPGRTWVQAGWSNPCRFCRVKAYLPKLSPGKLNPLMEEKSYML